LSSAARFSVPYPREQGYNWSWITLPPQTSNWSSQPIAAVNLNAVDFSPLQLSEGWLKLTRPLPQTAKDQILS
jgi:hypothetical protein